MGLEPGDRKRFYRGRKCCKRMSCLQLTRKLQQLTGQATQFTNQQIIDDYTAFINNWKNARQAIKVASQAKPAFERFLEAMSREHRNKLTLDALLIMPVQRIPRYELLIKVRVRTCTVLLRMNE